MRGAGQRDAPLSARQLELLKWLAQGQSQAQAARSMGIKPRSIGPMLDLIRGKLLLDNTTTYAQIVQAAREAGYEI